MKSSSKSKNTSSTGSSTAGKSKSSSKGDKDKAGSSKENNNGNKSNRSRGQKGSSYGNGASALLSQGRHAVDGAYEWVAGSAERLIPGRRSLQNLMEEQPLVVGAIGLGIGAIIGMMIPGNFMSNDSD